ncbi:OmpA family protein [Ascidiimonas sp. W6]|uniref:OmpA family protein n=1 Tax=Ascidiimonas meishanensis TaxID=3128903 RepID=UPI0030EC71AE
MRIKLLSISIILLFHTHFLFALHPLTHDSYNGQDISIRILTKDIKAGQAFQVNVNGAAKMNERAWLGIFKPNLNQKDPSGYNSYIYVRDQKSDEIEMTAPVELGEYELRLYSADPGDFVKAIKFNVTAVKPNQYTITILTDKIKPSQEFKVNITTTYKMDSRSWLGIFESDKNVSSPNGYNSYEYITEPYNSNLTFTAPDTPGNYTLRFYSADPGELITEIPFRTGQPNLPGIAFTLNKKAYDPEEEIIVNYVGHEDLAESAWIGLFKNEKEIKTYTKYFDYHYLQPKLKGQLKFSAPSTKGQYLAKMFYAETGPELLVPISFTVTSSLDNVTIKKSLNKTGKIILYGIYFDTNKSKIKEESYPLIKEIAKMLNADPSIKIRIEGHTDSQGDDNYNQSLSQERAEAVVKVLTTNYGVKKVQLESSGYGETKPIETNNTVDGRAKNRRVELIKI